KGVQKADVLKPARENYQGYLMANVGYSAQEATTAIAENQVDVVAFGVPFIANPDLVERFKKNAPLNEAKPEHFYLGGAEGYT
ncbi:oxidoreductase, partial [Vibrio diabolicus]